MRSESESGAGSMAAAAVLHHFLHPFAVHLRTHAEVAVRRAIRWSWPQFRAISEETCPWTTVESAEAESAMEWGTGVRSMFEATCPWATVESAEAESVMEWGTGVRSRSEAVVKSRRTGGTESGSRSKGGRWETRGFEWSRAA